MDRNVKYDYYRAIACIGVIFIHVFYSCNLIYGSSYSKSNNLVNNVLLNNFMWAVPAFFVITGALLLDKNKKITLGKLFSKYILRVLVALILFGTAFSVIDVFFGDKTPGLKAFFLNLYDVFKGKSWSHLWYLYCIIGIYLLLPFYKMAADNSDRKLLIYLLVVYAVFLSIVPLLNAFNIKKYST